MTCLHNHDQILEFLQKIILKGFQIYQNYLCALIDMYTWFILHVKAPNEWTFPNNSSSSFYLEQTVCMPD